MGITSENLAIVHNYMRWGALQIMNVRERERRIASEHPGGRCWELLKWNREPWVADGSGEIQSLG